MADSSSNQKNLNNSHGEKMNGNANNTLPSFNHSQDRGEALKTVAAKKLIKYVPLMVVPFLFILILFVILFNKDTFSGVGDGTDIYEDLRKEITEVVSKYNYKANVDGTLILATLVGYNDNNDLDKDLNMDYLISQVDKLAQYQIMTNRACDYSSLTLREIANNDDWLSGDTNYNCVPDMEGETYTLSIQQGDLDDDNSGSVYYWNLIDENFIFNFYNEYMINTNNNTSENTDKINEIIDEIYMYYAYLLESEDTNAYFRPLNSDGSFWWPVGSSETTVVGNKIMATGAPALTSISSNFGWRNIGGKRSFHGGIDISGEGQVNVHNVIAAKGGVVVYPTSISQTQFADHEGSAYGNNDGGGYGNYVKIDHGNGEYTLYAHMAQNSVTVMAGDVVEQGQVIGKVGHTGSSTGAHLHFEIYEGGSASEFRVDPLLYVSADNPRPSTNNISNWIKTIEGGTSGSYVDGDNYVVYSTSDGSIKVGYGITLVDKNGNRLYENIYNGSVVAGTLIPKETVDKIFNSMVDKNKALLNSYITDNNVVFSNNQYDAILSLMLDKGFTAGNEAVRAYGKAKDIQALWNVMSSYIMIEGENTESYQLKLRRAEEYELFLDGDYVYDPLSYTNGYDVKYFDVQNW